MGLAVPLTMLALVLSISAYALVGPDLTKTTGLHIPVDAGVAAAFLR